ncbi:hypothetical protein QQX98_000003 [Neonectria punicea]|uniref:Uncharacterized protein n=1 Tax=Neonectria punicea TaxID=979145 RepID=A0ABR1HW87_9HYPO
MRVSLFALPALAAFACAGPCRPSSSETTDITTTSSESSFSALTSETTSSVETTSSGEATSSAAETTSSTETETTSASTVEESTTSSELEVTTTSTTLESTTSTLESTTSTLESTTSLESVITTTSTTLESTTTSAAPEPTTTVLGFCLKPISTDKINYGYHVAGGTTQSNQIIQPPSNTVYNLYNLDAVTGAVTLNNTDPGKQIYLTAPYTTQAIRVIRFTTAPVTNGAVLCSTPSGEYTSGSVIKCTATGVDTSGTRFYDQFAASLSAAVGPWQMMAQGYTSTSYYNYEMGMFYGSDCRSQVAPVK